MRERVARATRRWQLRRGLRACGAPNALEWVAIGCLAIVYLAMMGCDGSGPVQMGDAQRGSAVVGGSVVSTVDGHPIELSEVEQIVSTSDLSPREALQRLQAERLLMAEADRRGYEGREVLEVATRALVQALLESEAQEVVVTEAEIQAAYERDTRFRAPEQRTSAHILIKLPPDATPADEADALGLAKAAIAELLVEPKEGFVLARYRKLRHPRLTIKGERLPAVAREGRFVREFEDAVFSLPEAGVVPEPVRTSFGFHAIKVIEIAPAVDIDLVGATKVLKEELLTEKRKQRVDDLLQAFRKRYGVELDGQAARSLLATLP